MISKNNKLSERFKNIQLKRNPPDKYNLYIIYSFILLLLIPGIYYLIADLIKESKYIKNNICELDDERKTKYKEVKKYSNAGMFCFSIYLTLNKFPYFSVFNKYYINFPKILKHIIVITGFYIGIISPLIPYLFIEFSERDIFIGQRDIYFEDSNIQNIPADNYKNYSLYFSPLGLVLGNLFIYIFSKLLDFEQEEADTWFKIKTVCKDYIYYEVKSEVLLGAIWKKIKNRMFAYYNICGNYILKKSKNNKFKEYLKHSSRNYALSATNSINEVEPILPRVTSDSIFSKDINNNDSNKKNKHYEMSESIIKKPLIEKDDDDDSKYLLNDYNNFGKRKMFNRKQSKINEDLNLKICKLDNFILDNAIKYDKSKRKIERFEKVRNKYIYVRKRNEIDEIEFEQSFDEKENNVLEISPQNNYFYLPANSLCSTKKSKSGVMKENDVIFHKFFLYSFVLLIIIILLIISTYFLIDHILIKFDLFILKVWIIPILVLITLGNFILYFFKLLFGSFLLFYFYHLRKKRCFCRFLFWLFVDRTMIQIYKVKNLITKYKKEFDHL